MFGFIFRSLWRLLIFALGASIVYLTIFDIYPYADNRLPAFVVVFALYCLAAYVVIPTLVRLFRLVIKPNRLPIYATSGDGWSSDPVNIALICKNKSQLTRMMTRAGWHRADTLNLRTSLRLLRATVVGQSYPTAPFSNLYLFGRKHDIGFQIQTGENPSPRHRHHIRFWQLQTKDTSKDRTFWEALLHLFLLQKQQIWIGTATYDVALFALRAQDFKITHRIDPNTNRERDFVIDSLKAEHLVKRIETVRTGEPLSFRGQTFGVRIVVEAI